MSDDRSMSVKAYLDVGGGRQEVRRFGLAEGIATNFTCLKEKVCSVFGLGQQDITLSWKDSEGDLIVISSDEELVEAIADSLSKQKLQLFKVSVTVGTRPDLGLNNSLPGSQQGAVHEGVVCDGCEGSVRGFRYRCVSCRDFDLCAACEFKGKHSEHRMMRMPKPDTKVSVVDVVHQSSGGRSIMVLLATSPPTLACTLKLTVGQDSPPHLPQQEVLGWLELLPHLVEDGEVLEATGAMVAMAATVVMATVGSEGAVVVEEEASGAAPGPCPFMDMEHDGPNPQQVAEEAQQMAEEVAQQAHRFASQMASEHVANVMRGIWTAWTGGQNNPINGSHASGDNEKKAEDKNDTQGSKPPGEDYLKSVGETVATILDPLGIDVEVSVEHNGIRQRCSLGSEDIPSRQGSAASTPEVPSKGPCSEAGSVGSGRSINIEVQTDDQPTSQASKSTSAGAEEMEVSSPAGEQMEAEHNASDTEDWTLVNQEAAPEVQSTAQQPSAPSDRRVEYPNLSELTPHPNPTIQRALDQMQSMGYNNEGGWLTNLLEIKGGDINQVLDILQPVNK
ncbi:hypothetical protein C7M84_017630 [Penaeus vannamei]|uniref:Sequestosome-1 n=1 Tax=Penaeus vannamei TaxID=6689 RepID=A0A3R7M152_PENVA|nr:hypothetical protein C7M84_017630 [Penaeus vannamei]